MQGFLKVCAGFNSYIEQEGFSNVINYKNNLIYFIPFAISSAIEADERTSLLAYKPAVAFPSKLSATGFLPKNVALGESETAEAFPQPLQMRRQLAVQLLILQQLKLLLKRQRSLKSHLLMKSLQKAMEVRPRMLRQKYRKIKTIALLHPHPPVILIQTLILMMRSRRLKHQKHYNLERKQQRRRKLLV